MTPVILLDCLKEFVEENTSDILLEVKTKPGQEAVKERAAQVYKMGLPEKDDVTQQVPYILLKLVTGEDGQEPGKPKESGVKVRIIVATYSQDAQEGQLALLNVILRLRERMQRAGVIGGRFCLGYPFEYVIYQDATPPYHLGEIMTVWSIPAVEREVKELWQ